MSNQNKSDGANIPSLTDKLPVIFGNLTAQACLASYPLALMAVSLAAGVGSTIIEITNQKQAQNILAELGERLTVLEKEEKLQKSMLLTNQTYQEVAQKRLLMLSSLDSEEDLEISASLIAMASINDSLKIDKNILRAINEISTDEVKILILIQETGNEFRKGIANFTDSERSDAESFKKFRDAINHKFSQRGLEISEIYNFEHLCSRLHSIGLIELDPPGNFLIHEFYPKITQFGKHFISRFNDVHVSSTIP